MTTEHQIEQELLAKLAGLKCVYHPNIPRDRAALEANFSACWMKSAPR